MIGSQGGSIGEFLHEFLVVAIPDIDTYLVLQRIDECGFNEPQAFAPGRGLRGDFLQINRLPGNNLDPRAEFPCTLVMNPHGHHGHWHAFIQAVERSTGGTTAKRWGRVGDSPIIGAGTYATPGCGVSATGTGEYFIRLGVSHEICSYIKLKGLTPDKAGARVLDDVKELGGDGGVIVLTPAGDSAFVFNTEGMFRGIAAQGRGIETGIYGDED